MKLPHVVLCSGVLILVNFVQNGDSTLMLGTMMLAAKTGLLLSKMGVGGMMMMLLAAQQNNDNGSGAYGKKRGVRSVDEQNSTKPERNETQDEVILTERIMRQIDSTFDTFSCIPKFVCGMNAEPPSKKTSLINDYGHLLKIIFSRGDGDDDDESEEEEIKRPKNKQDLRIEVQESDNIEDMVNEELIDDDPGMLPFILKDVVNKKKKNGQHMKESPMILPPRKVPFHKRPSKFSPMSSLASFLPKVEAGLGTKIKDSDFDSDPFFSGFRSLNSNFETTDTKSEHSIVPIIDLDDMNQSEKPMTRRERKQFIQRKAKELEMTDDPVIKYRIATEAGKQLKNKKDCTKIFKKCPYKWEEVTGVVDNLKSVISAHPIIAGPQKAQSKDKVVYLKTSPNANSNQSMLSIAAASTAENGATTVVHDLGNGNLMEIQMKLVPMVPLEAVPTPAIEILGVELKPNITIPAIGTVYASPNPPILTDDEIESVALAYQTQNANGSWAKRQKPITIGNMFPFLKEEEPTLPPLPAEDDDEIEDAFPILAANKNRKKKKPTKFKTTTTSAPIRDTDDYTEGDDEEDDEDDDDYEQERRAAILVRRSSSANQNRPIPFFTKIMSPFRIVEERGGTYPMYPQRRSFDLPHTETKLSGSVSKSSSTEVIQLV